MDKLLKEFNRQSIMNIDVTCITAMYNYCQARIHLLTAMTNDKYKRRRFSKETKQDFNRELSFLSRLEGRCLSELNRRTKTATMPGE